MNLLFIPLTIGLPAIDESLEKLLTAMETFPNVAVLGDAVSMAKALGLCLALCVGSYECLPDDGKYGHGSQVYEGLVGFDARFCCALSQPQPAVGIY